MSALTLFFILVIVVCTTFIILFNSIAAKLGRMEARQKELEAQLKREFDLQHQPIPEPGPELEPELGPKLESERESERESEIEPEKESEIEPEKESEIEPEKGSEREPANEPANEAEDIKNLVASARQSYNEAVAVYNGSIARFPGILVAGIFGFKAIIVEEEKLIP